MFKFAARREVWWPVKISVPVDGGRTESYDVEIRYLLLTRDDLQRVNAAGPERAQDELAKHVLDWRGFAQENDAELLCNADNKAALLKHEYIERPISVGLFQASRGAAAKN